MLRLPRSAFNKLPLLFQGRLGPTTTTAINNSVNRLAFLLESKLKFETNTKLLSRSFSATSAVPKVVTDDGVFKTWKPVTPGVRHKKVVSRKHLHKGKPIWHLTKAKRRTGGRNHHGHITCRHRGGGAKRRIRLVDFKRNEPGLQEVVRLEYDPGRTAWIALLKHCETGKFSYILAPEQLKPGMFVQSFMQHSEEQDRIKREKIKKEGEDVLRKMKLDQEVATTSVGAEEGSQDAVDAANDGFEAKGSSSDGAAAAASTTPENDADVADETVDKNGRKLWTMSDTDRSITIVPGNCLPLKMIPAGTLIHNIGLHKGDKGRIARSAGSYAQLLNTAESGTAQIKLMSGEVRKVPVDVCATIGTVSNPNHRHEKLGKAGARRHRGWRPTVRGLAMNKHDHPHGGGRGKNKSRHHPVSPWGKPAKGGKTRLNPNPMVIRSRKFK
ncbi:mitochondrial 54S ribosomal protein rml2 [Mycoemilia scoparia]|uniref:Large ribosomal subunit protein uL2m n=1 Tax=Mycoemilia scoparia TaxID=417184 RepID=A0A9W8A0N6_9FUNG|nr:mitochondrial 54S ribosomal protein rml2 [Mycoemilia scoparia]